MKKELSVLIFFYMSILLSCSGSSVKDLESPRAQYDKAFEYFNKGKNFKAQMNFQKVIYNYPGQTFIDTAQFHLGMSFFNMKNYPEAIGEFRRLLTAYPVSEYADDATFYIGVCYYKQSPNFALDPDFTNDAIDELGMFLNRYPGSPYTDQARVYLLELNDKLAKKLYKNGKLYLKLTDYEPALMYFQQVRDNYPNTEWAQLAFFDSGVAQMKLGRNEEAITTFQNFIITFPDHKKAQNARKNISKIEKEAVGG
jgi:outer membrane protein assembly factor BamD